MNTEEHIKELAERLNKSVRTVGRWLRRYREGGRWALAPAQNTEMSQQSKTLQPLALGSLDEAALDTLYTRRQLLGELATKTHVSDAEMRERAQEVGVTSRTLWTYRRNYQQHGLAGLAPQLRADTGSHHGITERMITIIRGIRLSQPDIPTHEVYKRACEKARLLGEAEPSQHQVLDFCGGARGHVRQLLGEAEPSQHQVRQICEEIPLFIKQIADKRENAFRNTSRITYRMQFRDEIILQIDHTQVDTLVKDLRPKHRTKSGEIRPWLTTALVANARLLGARRFSYDEPDRFVVAAVIRDALLMSDDKPYCGLVDEIWVDNGKDLISRHVQNVTSELGIRLYNCAPHQPQTKGIVERFFGTLNTRLWSTLPGYVGSNTVERNPTAKAELTLQELAERFDAFIHEYHHEVHSELSATPLQFWLEHYHPEPVDTDLLDLALQEKHTRRIIKEGIKYKGRVYWHQELATRVGQDIIIRTAPHYLAPDEIEVFTNNVKVCTAFATDSDRGKAVTPAEVAQAQHEQRATARNTIAEGKEALDQASPPSNERPSSDADTQKANQTPPLQEPSVDTKPLSSNKQSTPSKGQGVKKPKKDIFDRLLDL